MMTMVMVVGGIKGKVSGELGSHPFLCVTFLKIFLMFSFACNTKKSNACIENLFVAGHDVSLEKYSSALLFCNPIFHFTLLI